MQAHGPTRADLEAHLGALGEAFAERRAGSGEQRSGWLLHDPSGLHACRLLASFEERVKAEGGTWVAGAWRENLLRPFGGFLDLVDDLAARVFPQHPEMLRRYGLPLASLLSSWREAEPLRNIGEMRSGLADFILHGDKFGINDYYWKRNVGPLIVAHLVHFALDAAAAISASTGAPVVFSLENLHLANALSVDTLHLLNRYAWQAPLLICATARDLSGGVLSRLTGEPLAPGAWRELRLEETPEETDCAAFRLQERLAPEQREVVAAASVMALPFQASALLHLLPEYSQPDVEETLSTLGKERLLRRIDKDRFAFSCARFREAVYDDLSTEQRRRFHASSLTSEASDPFAAVWHASEAGLPDEVHRHALQAMERAWAVADFDSAIVLGERALASANGEATVNGEVMLALLHYEAGRHAEAERFLVDALERRRHEGIDRLAVERMLGHNAIFGLGDFERGQRILESVLKGLEERGHEQEAGYVRNSIAFALLRTQRFEDAIELENLTLKLIENSQQQHGFLSSILQLNLGRLYRTVGFSEQALTLFRKGMEGQDSELSPYVLIVFHSSIAFIHSMRGEHADALAAYQHCLELARDLELEDTNDQLLSLLNRPVGSLLSDRATRNDQFFYGLYLNLVLTYRRLGLRERADAYMASMRRRWSFLGQEVWHAAEAELAACVTAKEQHQRNTVGEFVGRVEQMQHRFTDLLHEFDGREQRVEVVAEALANKQSVAVVLPRQISPDAHLFESLVLYDPREQALTSRLNAEVGAYNLPVARAALLLPEVADWFGGGFMPLPLVMQEATLKPQHRRTLAALVPYRVRLQMLSPDYDGIMHDILHAFAQRTGVGVLAAIPFHLREHDLSVTPENAIQSYLVSSIDHLLVADRLLAKTHGPVAPENILPFSPRLSQRATIIKSSPDEENSDTFVIMIRIWSRRKYLRLRNETRAILNLCDGERSVAEIVRHLETEFQTSAAWQQRVCNFVRELWRQGAICFTESLVQEKKASRNTS